MRHGKRVVLVAFDGIPMFDLSTATAVFGTDDTVAEPLFDFRIVSGLRGPVRVLEGATIIPDTPLEAVVDADTIIVPAFSSANCPPQQLAEVTELLLRAHDGGARLVAFCGGVVVLAQAGLLDGRSVTTHWFSAAALSARYPAVRFDTDSLYIDDGDVVTAAGAMAGLDCCLALVAKDHGSAVAQAIARRMNAPMMREAGNPQYVEHTTPGSQVRDALEPVLDWARDNVADLRGTDALVARAGMSRRHFDRRFREVTGTTPKQWLLHQQLLRARLLLETTPLSVEQIARRAGFASGLAMRPHFRKRFGISPRDYRRAFEPRGDG